MFPAQPWALWLLYDSYLCPSLSLHCSPTSSWGTGTRHSASLPGPQTLRVESEVLADASQPAGQEDATTGKTGRGWDGRPTGEGQPPKGPGDGGLWVEVFSCGAPDQSRGTNATGLADPSTPTGQDGEVPVRARMGQQVPRSHPGQAVVRGGESQRPPGARPPSGLRGRSRDREGLWARARKDGGEGNTANPPGHQVVLRVGRLPQNSRLK